MWKTPRDKPFIIETHIFSSLFRLTVAAFSSSSCIWRSVILQIFHFHLSAFAQNKKEKRNKKEEEIKKTESIKQQSNFISFHFFFVRSLSAFAILTTVQWDYRHSFVSKNRMKIYEKMEKRHEEYPTSFDNDFLNTVISARDQIFPSFLFLFRSFLGSLLLAAFGHGFLCENTCFDGQNKNFWRSSSAKEWTKSHDKNDASAK